VAQFARATDPAVAQKDSFLVLEKIFFDSRVLTGYLTELAKLQALKKMKNYDLLEKEIDVLAELTENTLLFKSLQNAMKQDLFRFLDDVDQSFADNLDLGSSAEVLLHNLRLQTKISRKFHRDERKILKSTFDSLVSLLKESLTSNLRSNKGKTRISSHQLKFAGYLRYFEVEIEKNDTELLDSYFGFYATTYQHLAKIVEVVRQESLLSFYSNEVNESFLEILSQLLQNIGIDVESLKGAPVRKLRSFIANFAPLYTNFEELFNGFEFVGIKSKFGEPVRLLLRLSVEACSELSGSVEKSLGSMEVPEFLASLRDVTRDFLEFVIVPLKEKRIAPVYDLFDKYLDKVGKRVGKIFSAAAVPRKLEVVSLGLPQHPRHSRLPRQGVYGQSAGYSPQRLQPARPVPCPRR
jgi:hypothetical protein